MNDRSFFYIPYGNNLYVLFFCLLKKVIKKLLTFCYWNVKTVFKETDRTVFLDKREFTGPIYTQIEEAVDFVLRNIRLGATIDGLVRKERYELPPEADMQESRQR
nr:hypothetical protein [Blautia obeum]